MDAKKIATEPRAWMAQKIDAKDLIEEDAMRASTGSPAPASPPEETIRMEERAACAAIARKQAENARTLAEANKQNGGFWSLCSDIATGAEQIAEAIEARGAGVPPRESERK